MDMTDYQKEHLKALEAIGKALLIIAHSIDKLEYIPPGSTKFREAYRRFIDSDFNRTVNKK